MWLHDQRPQVIGTILTAAWGGNVYGGTVATKHEFHSLAVSPLVAEYQGQRVWTPTQPGIEFTPVPHAPRPSRSSQIRGSQMVELAGRFQAQIGEQQERRNLRLEPNPIYRYENASTDGMEGALFAFLHGGDPELVLMIEARGQASDARWHWAPVRLSEKSLTVAHQGEPVWTDSPPPRVGHQSIFEFPKYRERTYISYVPAAVTQFRIFERRKDFALASADLASELRRASRVEAAAQAAIAGLSAWGQREHDARDVRIERLHREIRYAVDALREGGRVAEAEKAAAEAVKLYQQLSLDFPDVPNQKWLAYLYAELGQFSAAAGAYSKASQQESDSAAALYWSAAAAVAWLGAGDEHAYCDACSDLLRQYEAAEDPGSTASLAETCLYAPRVANRSREFAQLIEQLIQEDRPWVGQPVLIDDFDDLNDDGWTRQDLTVGQPWGPGAYDAGSGNYRFVGAGNAPGGPMSAICARWDRSADPRFSNGFLRAKVRVDTDVTTALLCLRISEAGCYVFGGNVVTGRFYIQRVAQSGRASPSLVRLDDPRMRFTAGKDWMFEAGAVGDQLTLKVWPVGKREPDTPQLDGHRFAVQLGPDWFDCLRPRTF